MNINSHDVDDQFRLTLAKGRAIHPFIPLILRAVDADNEFSDMLFSSYLFRFFGSIDEVVCEIDALQDGLSNRQLEVLILLKGTLSTVKESY